MAFGDFTVTRASTKNVLGSNGLYQSVANDTPAFEFNTDGSYRGLLVEPGATNLALQSQTFETTWAASDATVGANATTAPDGTTTADKIVVTATNQVHQVSQVVTLADSLTYTFSVFAKKSELNWLSLVCTNKASLDYSAWFNLDTGVVGTVGAGTTARISLSGNGYYRCEISYPSQTGAGTTSQRIRANSADNQSTWLGDGTSGIFIWQAQLETGSVATSPIVTTGSTASRVADVVSLTGASSLIGQSAGSIFVEYIYPTLTADSVIRRLISLNDGTTSNMINVGAFGSSFDSVVTTGGVAQTGQSFTPTPNIVNRLTLGYELNNVVTCSNGALTSVDTSATIPATSQINIGNRNGSQQFIGWIRAVALYPTRLPTATLQALTTL